MGKRGPAPKGEYVNKSKVLSTRIREDTREALALAAKKSGRSLSQEIEHRLRRSFDLDQRISEAFADEQLFALMRTIAAVMRSIFNPKDFRTWSEDAYAFDQAVRAVNSVLESIRPPGDPTAAPNNLGEAWRMLAEEQGNMRAAFALHRIAHAPDELPLHARDRAPFIKAGLGPLADRIGKRLVVGTAEDMRRAAEELEAAQRKPSKRRPRR